MARLTPRNWWFRARIFTSLPGDSSKSDEVLEEVHEVTLVADALEQGFHVHDARFLLGQALPLVEMLEAAGSPTPAWRPRRWPTR